MWNIWSSLSLLKINKKSYHLPPTRPPTTRRHLGFATKMPDEHFYKSIMNKCVFAWLSSRQARLFLYSPAKLLIIIRFTKFPCIFFPPISPCFLPFLPISRHYPPHLHFLTISMDVRCCARVRCFARWKCKVLRTGKVLRTLKFIGARTLLNLSQHF